MQLASLFVKVGLSGQDSLLQGLGKIRTSTAVAGAEIAAVITGLVKMTSAAKDAALALDKYVTFTGKSAQELQKLSFELGQTGVSMSEVQGTLQALERQRTDMLLGRGYNPAFVLLGIDPRTDPVQMLEELRDRVQKIQDPNVAKALANQLGISDEIYYSLTKDSNALDEFGQKLIMMDKERLNLIKMNREWEMILWYVKNLAIKFGAMNAEWIKDFLHAVVRVVQYFGDWAMKIADMVEKNKTLRAILIALTAIFQPVITGVVAFIGVLEDLVNFLNGADSVIGRFGNYIDKYFGDYIRGAIELLKTFWGWLDKTFGLIDKVKTLWEDTKKSAGGQFISNSLEALKMGFKEMFSPENSSAGTNGWAHAFAGVPNDFNPAYLAPNVTNNSIGGNKNLNTTVNNYNTFNGYSPDELRPQMVALTEKDVSDARMESPENAGNI